MGEVIYTTYADDLKQRTTITNEDIERLKELSKQWER